MDRPIIFSGPMVRALLAGRKTQTRRLATSPLAKCSPGDRLWVRESFRTEHVGIDGEIYNRVRYPEDEIRREFDPMKYKPSIHMPRWASRLTLLVGAVKGERLQYISEFDAIAEGLVGERREAGYTMYRMEGAPTDCSSSWAPAAFLRFWDHLHGKGEADKNPEIVALTFTVEQRNIDAKEAA